MRDAVYFVMDIRPFWEIVLPALRTNPRLDSLTDGQCFDTWLWRFAQRYFKVVDDEPAAWNAANEIQLTAMLDNSNRNQALSAVMPQCDALWRRYQSDIPIACYSKDVTLKRIKHHVIWFFLDYY